MSMEQKVVFLRKTEHLLDACSRPAIQAFLMANYKVNLNRFQDNIRRTLLTDTGCIIQTKQKFKLEDEGRKYLKQKPMKKVKVTKEDEKCDNRVIQDTIDNENILDIMYDDSRCKTSSKT